MFCTERFATKGVVNIPVGNVSSGYLSKDTVNLRLESCRAGYLYLYYTNIVIRFVVRRCVFIFFFRRRVFFCHPVIY